MSDHAPVLAAQRRTLELEVTRSHTSRSEFDFEMRRTITKITTKKGSKEKSKKKEPEFNGKLPTCKSTLYPATYPMCKYNKTIHSSQTAIAARLTEQTDGPCEIVEKAIGLSQTIESPLREKLEQISDPLDLVPLQSEILEGYKSAVEQGQDAKRIEELLLFTAKFVPGKYSPRDCAIKAEQIADRAGPAGMDVMLIASVTASDFIDRSLYEAIDRSLKLSRSVDVQVVRWMYRNINETQIIEAGGQNPFITERSLEIPEIDNDSHNPQTANSIDKVVSRSISSINRVLERTEDTQDEWRVVMTQLVSELTDLGSGFTMVAKFLQRTQWVFDTLNKLEELVPVFEKMSGTVKKSVDKLIDQFTILALYLQYMNKQDKYTVNSVLRVLRDCRKRLDLLMSETENPEILARCAVIESSIMKVESAVPLPSANDKSYSACSEFLLELQKQVDDPEISDYIMVAEWILKTQKLDRTAIQLQLCETVETVKRMATIIESQEQSEVTSEWSQKLTKWFGNLVQWADSSDANSNADSVAEMRNEVDGLVARSAEIGISDETNELVSELESLLTSMYGKVYRHRSKKSMKVDSSAALFTSTARVSFAPVDVFKTVEGANYDLIPEEIEHPVYEAWYPSTIGETIRMMKAVPIDIKGLGKVATQKLRTRNSRGTISMKMSDVPCFRSGLLAFSLRLSERAFKKPIEADELDAVIAKSIENLDIIERDFSFIDDTTSFVAKVEMIERLYPLIEDIYWQDHPEVAARYDQVVTVWNELIDRMTMCDGYILPKDIIVILHERVSDLIAVMERYHTFDELSSDEESHMVIRKWTDYLHEVSRVINLIRIADDEVVIYNLKGLFTTLRGHFSSLNHPAEVLDQKASRKTLVVLTSSILKIIESIIRFNQSVASSDLCTVSDAQSRLSNLSEKFATVTVDIANAAEAFEKTKTCVAAILDAPDINTSSADDACQKLKSVQVDLGSYIQKERDEAYDLFIAIVGLRVSLKNLHVSDAEPDQKLAEMSSVVMSDFERLIEFISNGLSTSNKRKADFITLWVHHLKLCQKDIAGVHKGSELVEYSPTRFAQMADNMSNIHSSLTVLEDSTFPISVTPYNKLALHLDKLIEYCKVKHMSKEDGKRASTRRISEGLALQMNTFMTMTGVGGSVSTFGDSAYSEFSDGFIKTEFQYLVGQIAENVAESFEDKQSVEYKVVVILGDLFRAHAASFTRNHSICAKSTRVCYELLREFCKSIMECTSEASAAVASKDTTKLSEVVATHVQAIEQIQSEYDDQSTNSAFGMQRLTVFAHLCCIVAQITTLNIFELCAQEEQFDFEETHMHARRCVHTFHEFSEKFEFKKTFNSLDDLENMTIGLEDTPERFINFLDNESKFCESLDDLIEDMMAIEDRRLWQAQFGDFQLASSVIAKPDKDAGHVMAADLKRNMDMITEHLMQFKTTLMVGDIDEVTLLAQIDGIDGTTKILCETAVCVQADKSFYDLIQLFREQIVKLVNHLRHELFAGTYSLYSKQVNILMNDVNKSCIHIIKQLGYIEQLEEDSGDVITTIFARLAKLLFLARDDLAAAAVKTGLETFTAMAKTVGASYETVANVILTIKNSNARVLRKLQTEKVNNLRHIIFATQVLLNAAGDLGTVVAKYDDDQTESPEFQLKANLEPVVEALIDIKKSIPKIIPHAGTLMQLMSSIITEMRIVMEPRYEERPLFAVEE